MCFLVSRRGAYGLPPKRSLYSPWSDVSPFLKAWHCSSVQTYRNFMYASHEVEQLCSRPRRPCRLSVYTWELPTHAGCGVSDGAVGGSIRGSTIGAGGLGPAGRGAATVAPGAGAGLPGR